MQPVLKTIETGETGTLLVQPVLKTIETGETETLLMQPVLTTIATGETGTLASNVAYLQPLRQERQEHF